MSFRVKYCCGCIPLRNGLLIWGYFSLIMTYLSALVTLRRLQNIMNRPSYISEPNQFFISFSVFLGVLVNFIFNIVLVVGLHRKSCCKLEVYNGYLIISMVLEGIVSGLYIPLAMVRLFRADNDESMILIWMSLYCAAFIIALLELLWKYYILTCVRSLISTLGSKEEELDPELTEVIVLDYIKRKRKYDNEQSRGNDDFTRIVHDNTNNKEKDDNLQPVETLASTSK